MLQEFCGYLYEQVANHSIYVFGAQGQDMNVITDQWIKGKETGLVNAMRAIAFWNKQVKAGYGGKFRAFDCSGLGMYFLQNMQGIFKSDMNANGMMGQCAIISKAQLKKGDWAFRVYTLGSEKGRAYHIGYVADDALNVVEAQGRDQGVVKRTLNAGGANYWNAFGRPSIFKAEIETQKVQQSVCSFGRLLKYAKPYMQGADVKNLQILLQKSDFSPGSLDGIFGRHTRDAVRAFQKSKKLKVDGIAGKNTISALGGIWTK